MKKTIILFIAVFIIGSVLTADETDIKIIALSLEDEYVLIQNTGQESIDMSGWAVTDRYEKHTYVFKNYELASNSILQLQSGDKRFRIGKLKEADDYILWTKRNVWNNMGDTVYLYNSKGKLIAKYLVA